MGADLRPSVLASLLDLLGVLDAKLGSGLDGTLLPLGSRELTGSELLQVRMTAPGSVTAAFVTLHVACVRGRDTPGG